MEAHAVVEGEVRELIRRSGVDPVRDRQAVSDLVREAVSDYDERSMHGGMPLLGNFEDAVKRVMDAVAGFGPIQEYFDDPTVEEIWINAPPFVGNFLLDWRPSISGGVSTRASRFADTRAPRGSGHQCVNGGTLVGLKVRIDRSGGQRCCRVKTWSSSPAVPRRRC